MFQNSHLKERAFDFIDFDLIDMKHIVCKIVVNKFRQFEGAILSFFVVFVFHFATIITLDNLIDPIIAIGSNDILFSKHRFNTGVFLCIK